MLHAETLSLKKIKVTLPNGKTLFTIKEFSISPGNHILIQGESGKGKTTLLHLMAGLFSPTEGNIYWGEANLNNFTDDERCDWRRNKIGVIFQKLNIIDHLTVYENIALSTRPLSHHNPLLSQQKVHQSQHINILKALSRVSMLDRQDDRCSYLSLGEQQRVAVARVIAQEPSLILADEPTSSLDDKNSQFVMDALFEIAREKSLVVVSHDHRIRERFKQITTLTELAQCPP